MPIGDAAISTILFGQDASVPFTAYQVNLVTGARTSLGTGSVFTTLDHVDYTATDLDYMMLIVDVSDTTADTIFGGRVTISEGGPATMYSAAFNNSTNWTFSSFPGVAKWAVDGTPAGAPGGAFNSASTSLNYNDGVDYDDGGSNQGIATLNAGILDLTGTVNPVLTFFCNYETDTTGTATDKREVLISNNGFTSTLLLATLATVGPINIGACSTIGTWHQHTVPLTPSWGAIQIRFRFSTVNAVNNAFAGWFVDDFVVMRDADQKFVRITPDQFLVNDD